MYVRTGNLHLGSKMRKNSRSLFCGFRVRLRLFRYSNAVYSFGCRRSRILLLHNKAFLRAGFHAAFALYAPHPFYNPRFFISAYFYRVRGTLLRAYIAKNTAGLLYSYLASRSFMPFFRNVGIHVRRRFFQHAL